MRTVHVYKTGDKLYASAAESVPALLGKEPFKIVVHDAVGCITCALGKAVERTVNGLRHGLARNIQASLLAGAVLALLGWPLVYNAIPMPEIVLAARIASGVLTGLGLFAAAVACVQIYQLTHHIDFALATIVYKKDGLLPRATAWRQTQRRVVFPWLGLGLILFSIALNCVVVADYTHPAVLSDGTVRRSMGLAPPWVTWETGIRYFEDSFFVVYSYDEQADEFHVLRVAYRVENIDQTTPPLPGWKTWLISLCNRVVAYTVENMPGSLPPDATDNDTRLALTEVFEYDEYRSGFLNALKSQWAERYAPDLKLVAISYKLLVVSRAEATEDYERHKD